MRSYPEPAKVELEGLRRRQLMDSEESGYREQEQADLRQAQREQLEAALTAQRSAEARLGETERQGAQLEQALEASESRCKEHALALSNLQGLLEQLQAQARAAMRRAQTRPARERRRSGASTILRHLAHAVARAPVRRLLTRQSSSSSA